jgi:hypothetical protein
MLTQTKIWPNATYPVKKYLFLFFKIIIFEGNIFLNPKKKRYRQNSTFNNDKKINLVY